MTCPSARPPTFAPSNPTLTWKAAAGFKAYDVAHGVARLGSRVVALGSSLTVGGAASMAAFSGDGLHWATSEPGLTPQPDVTLLAGAHDQCAGDVLVGTQLVLGPEGEDGGLRGAATGVAFVRRGPAWVRGPGQPELANADLRGVLAIGGRFVAYGGYDPDNVGLGCSWSCVNGFGIWASNDGETWVRALGEPGPWGMTFVRVVAGPSGLLAMGVLYADDPAQTRIWTSEDGVAWTDVQPVGLEGVGLSDVLGRPDGYLGVTDGLDGRLYESADGIHWSSRTGPNLSGLAQVPDGLIGWNNQLMSSEYGMWWSADGSRWMRQGTYDDFYSTGVVQIGDRFISTGSNSQAHPVWVGS